MPAHVQLGDVPRTLDPAEVEGEFRQHGGVMTVMMKLPTQGHYTDMTEVEICGGGHRTRLNNQLLCLWGAPSPVYKGVEEGTAGPHRARPRGESYSHREPLGRAMRGSALPSSTPLYTGEGGTP